MKNQFKNMARLLKMARKESDTTQRQVSRALKLSSPQFMSNAERGLCSLPPKHFQKYAKITGVNIRRLISAHVADSNMNLKNEVFGRKK